MWIKYRDRYSKRPSAVAMNWNWRFLGEESNDSIEYWKKWIDDELYLNTLRDELGCDYIDYKLEPIPPPDIIENKIQSLNRSIEYNKKLLIKLKKHLMGF